MTFDLKLKYTFICLLSFIAFNSSALQEAKPTDIKTYRYAHGRNLKVVYYAHNNANIKEFLMGKDTVNEILNKIAKAGFEPKVDYLEVAISPQEMVSGHVVVESEGLFVAISATPDLVERNLLRYFKFKRTNSRFVFFPHNNPVLSEFFLAKQAVDRVIARFAENGLEINVDYLEIGISPVEMIDGNVVTRDGKLFISLQATDDQIERYLMKFVRY